MSRVSRKPIVYAGVIPLETCSLSQTSRVCRFVSKIMTEKLCVLAGIYLLNTPGKNITIGYYSIMHFGLETLRLSMKKKHHAFAYQLSSKLSLQGKKRRRCRIFRFSGVLKKSNYFCSKLTLWMGLSLGHFEIRKFSKSS